MKILAIAAASALMASQAYAGSYEVRCETTRVPYQATVKGGEPEKVIGGAVVGGVLGKAVTDENAGAVAGAVIGHEASRKTVTRYKDVETCKNVFVPELVRDRDRLERVVSDLNAGRSVSKETIMDVQYTIGVAYDGKWGPMSRRAATDYLASFNPDGQSDAPLYSLVVNDVVVVSSADANAIDEIKKGLLEAGVASKIYVDLDEAR